MQDQAVTQGVVGGVIFWCAYGCGFADPIPGCRHTGCWQRGLSQRVSLEVSSDACVRVGTRVPVIFYICILVCFLPRNIEDVSCESAWDKLQNIVDIFRAIWGLCWYIFYKYRTKSNNNNNNNNNNKKKKKKKERRPTTATATFAVSSSSSS